MSVFHPLEKSYWLHKVCETNFLKLLVLAPELARLGTSAIARAGDRPALHLRLLNRSPYTLTLELTHDFDAGLGTLAEPAVRLRVCLDAKTCEVLSDHCRPTVTDALRERATAGAVLDYKWSMNYFLARWLDHCLSNDYRFALSHLTEEECCVL